MASAEALGEEGAETVGERQRQAPPGGGLQAVAGAARGDVALRALRRIGEGAGIEAPILLEGEGPGAELGAAEVEAGAAPVGGVAHQREIEEVVGAKGARLAGAAAPIGMDDPLEIEAEHR